jgi:hypothetical protein
LQSVEPIHRQILGVYIPRHRNIYRCESDVVVRERILVVRRVMVNREEAVNVAELELHRSRGWAYKWSKRFANEGKDGLKVRHRSDILRV